MSNTSRAIREIEHNSDTNELTVTFQSGSRYKYENVDRSLAEEFANADSKGAFFNRRLSNLYWDGKRVN